VSDGETSSSISAHGIAGQCGRGSAEGMPPNRDPIVSTGKSRSCTAAVASTMATNGAGTSRHARGQRISTASDPGGDGHGRPLQRPEVVRVRGPLLDEVRRDGTHAQSEKVFDLTGEDDHGDSGGEAG